MKEWPDPPQPIEVVFHERQWATPTGMVGLACLIERNRRLGGSVALDLNGSATIAYWHRMKFFREVGIDVPPLTVGEHPPNGRFAEMRKIDDIEFVDDLTASLVSVTNSKPEAFKIFSHILSEAMNNVCQHSDAHGFCAAQYWKASDRVEFCIADAGCGLRHALSRAYAPSTDVEALELALRVGVTGRRPAKNQTHMRNRGVGLSCIERLVRANNGKFELWSGNARFGLSSGTSHIKNNGWTGTLLTVTMQREAVTADFRAVMQRLTEDLRSVEAERQVS